MMKNFIFGMMLVIGLLGCCCQAPEPMPLDDDELELVCIYRPLTILGE